MAITIFTEIKERLQTSCIAGSQMIGEDQRFIGLVEQLATWQLKSPVFAKLYALCKPLTNACENPQLQLLDALAFLDAVLCTQATGIVDIETQPFEVKETNHYEQFTYSQLKPVLQALETSGGGRYEIIHDAWLQHPGMFQDYRILPAVVKDLNDSYSELANLIQKIISEIKEPALPYLKEGFEPHGGKEMLRRIQLIVEIAKEKENDWYLSAFPTASADIKKELLRGLSYHQDNIAFLLTLAKTERGKVKEEVYYALGTLHHDSITSFFQEKLKKEEGAIVYLLYQQDETLMQYVCDLVKTTINQVLVEQRTQLHEKEALLLTRCQFALNYSAHDCVVELATWLLAHHEALVALQVDQKAFRMTKQGSCVGPLDYCSSQTRVDSLNVSYDLAIMDALLTTYIATFEERVKQAIITLFHQYPSLCASVYAHVMLLSDPKHAYDTLQKEISQIEEPSFYASLLSYIIFDKETKHYNYVRGMASFPNQVGSVKHELGSLDLRFVEALVQKKEKKKGLLRMLSGKSEQGTENTLVSAILVHLANPQDTVLKEMTLSYFDRYDISGYTLHCYHRYHMELHEVMASYYKKHQQELSYYAVSSIAKNLSKHKKDRIEALTRCKAIQEKNTKNTNSYFPEMISEELQRLTMEETTNE